ncbi:bifunctional lysylphosphatidylglycerol flippase/synthetase MprF [Pseudonocardia sp. GCM10023141]|uniref:bifunctional lysylphosphatidylglycerol flippase/synthetase MprF n=1 Tax=Pseudonocardia sp. GCM10023141 TaxID=3252653 RepID=UPI00360B0845
MNVAERARGTGSALVRAARHAPMTCTLITVCWLAGFLTGSIPGGASARLLHNVGAGPEAFAAGHWWTAVTGCFFWGSLGGHLVTTVLFLVAGPVAERRIGTARSVLLLFGTQVAGTLLASGLVGLGSLVGGRWAGELATQAAIGAAPGAVGLGLAVTSRISALWRRRLRILLLTTGIVLVAYSGALSDVVLLSAGLVGLVCGPLLLGRTDRSPGPASRHESRVLVAMIVAASAVGPVVAAAAGAAIGPLSVLQYLVLSPPPDADAVLQICLSGDADTCRELQAHLRLSGIGPALASAVPVILLLVIAEGLRRGRRAAWVLGVALNAVLAVLGAGLGLLIADTPDSELVVFRGVPGAQQLLTLLLPSLVPLCVVLLLLAGRAQFTVRAPAGTLQRTAATSVAVLGTLSILYVVGGTAVADQFDRPPTAAQLLADLPLRFLPPGYLGEVDPAFLPEGLVATLLFEWVGVAFWITVAAGLLAGFVKPRVTAAAADAARARALVVEHGGSDLAWITTWAGNSYWFCDQEAAIAYRVIGSVAVTTGDPIGRPERRADAVAGFARFCGERGWTPALYSITAPTRDACAELGWRSVQVAEEIVVPLEGLTFTGKRWQDVRTALNKAEREGIKAEWLTFSHAPLAITDQIRAISEEWVADKGLPEMGFTLGGLPELADDAVRCLVAVDTDRTVHGVTSWMPVHRDGEIVGWTLDFMRRRGTGGFRGTTEFLVGSAVRDLQEEKGVEFISLSGSPLARVDRTADERGLQRVLDALGAALEPVYGFRSLLAFKAKFQPVYAPLYLAYPDLAALPAIGFAIGRAYLPDLTPRQSARLLRRRRA